MSYGKFSIGLVLLFMSAVQLHAQWGPGLEPGSPPMPFGSREECHDVAVLVRDSSGTAIMGASVVTENNLMPGTTDANGVVEIPCRWVQGVLPVLKITASGYKPASVTLVSDSNSRFEVTLDKGEPIFRSAGTTVNAAELSPNAQSESTRLQEEAGKALAHQDYQNAGKLLMEAYQLTPSSPGIANNLGIVYLHLRDVESAGNWFQKAAEEAPYKGEILGNFGLALWLQHRTDESYSVLTKASAHGYESSLAHYILGTVSLERGKSQEAAEHLKKISPDKFRYRDLYLSIALRNCGKAKSADETYRNFLKRNPAPFLTSRLS